MGLAQKKKHESASELISALQGLHVSGDDLRRLIELTLESIQAELDRRVAAIKAGPDGAGLPVQTIAQTLTRGQCRCENALRWLANE